MQQNDYLKVRHDWQLEEIQIIFEQPLVDLLYAAHGVHRHFHNPHEVQACRIQSIKTGACPEDCKYCPQSGHYKTSIEKERLFSVEKALSVARDAKARGATRFCMGIAWREILDGEQFDRVLKIVEEVDALGLEACLTAGMLSKDQALRLKKAGCTSYNHNLDTSPEYYDKIISTRTYQNRLDTLNNLSDAGLGICCGGIIGLGESRIDRLRLLHQLATLKTHPESVPINLLAKYENMPLNDVPPPHPFEMVRMVATARLLMPKAVIRLAAGRTSMSDEQHALCYFAGANSVFMASEKLFITPNPQLNRDQEVLDLMGSRFSTRRFIKDKEQEITIQ